MGMSHKLVRFFRNIFFVCLIISVSVIAITIPLNGQPVKSLSDNAFAIFITVFGVVLVVGLIAGILWILTLVWTWLKKDFRRNIGLLFFLLFLICTTLAIYELAFYDSFERVFTRLFPTNLETERNIFLGSSFLGATSFFVWIFSLKNKLTRKVGMVLLPLLLILVFLYIFAIRLHKVSGEDMEPLFPHQSYMLGDLVSYRLGPPKRGDVVVFTSASDEYTRVGRIIGLPGENISIQGGRVYINNNLLPEPYINLDADTQFNSFPEQRSLLIPEGKYLIMRDKRRPSIDPKFYYYLIKREWIKERVFFDFK